VIFLANVVDKTREQVLFLTHGVWLKIKQHHILLFCQSLYC